MVHLQNRLGSLSKARVKTIEEITSLFPFNENLSLLGLDIDSVFYYQRAPWHGKKHTKEFLNELITNIQDEEGAFYF